MPEVDTGKKTAVEIEGAWTVWVLYWVLGGIADDHQVNPRLSQLGNFYIFLKNFDLSLEDRGIIVNRLDSLKSRLVVQDIEEVVFSTIRNHLMR